MCTRGGKKGTGDEMSERVCVRTATVTEAGAGAGGQRQGSR